MRPRSRRARRPRCARRTATSRSTRLHRPAAHPRRPSRPGRGVAAERPLVRDVLGFCSAGSTDISQIYDPRFTGYGDAYRSYRDVPAGQIKYYYTDVDAYKTPNFIIRNKVDHVDLHQPMGNTYSTYPREAALEDVRDQVNDDWMAQSTVFREDMMERLMRPANARNWQLRFAPKQRGARLSTFTSEY
jgi:hypothetical protein